MKKIFTTFLAVFFCLQTSAFAADQSEQVRKFVDGVGNKIIQIASEKGTSESAKKSKIITVIDSSINSDWIAKFVLGLNYKNATEPQKQHFLNLYRAFMINTYGPKFKNYNGRKFTVNKVEERGGFYIAKAEFLPHDSDVAISVDFRVKEKDGKLVILDFVAEGVSLIETQRSEFNSAISQKGMDEFLNDLALRVKKLKE